MRHAADSRTRCAGSSSTTPPQCALNQALSFSTTPVAPLHAHRCRRQHRVWHPGISCVAGYQSGFGQRCEAGPKPMVTMTRARGTIKRMGIPVLAGAIAMVTLWLVHGKYLATELDHLVHRQFDAVAVRTGGTFTQPHWCFTPSNRVADALSPCTSRRGTTAQCAWPWRCPTGETVMPTWIRSTPISVASLATAHWIQPSTSSRDCPPCRRTALTTTFPPDGARPLPGTCVRACRRMPRR